MNRFIAKIILSSIMISALWGTAAGAEKKRIAVLPFSTENVSPVTGKIVRDIIEVELISSRHYTVIERDQMGAILKEQKLNPKVCDETDCAFKYGKALSIDYMVIGKVMKLKNFVVSLRLIDVRNRVVLSADKLKSGSVEDLEDRAEELAEMFLDQLSSDNPVPYHAKIYRNRLWTINQTFYFQYTFVPSMALPCLKLPASYGDPINLGTRSKKHHAVAGGISTTVAFKPWLSVRGDLSFVAVVMKDPYSESEISFSEANFDTHEECYSLPYGLSGDIFVQFNWLWGPFMPHVSFGVGYSHYWRSSSRNYSAGIQIYSAASSSLDYYGIKTEFRSNIFSLVGDFGVTIYFSNNIGLILSWGMRYAPGQAFFKNAELTKDEMSYLTGPFPETYQNLDEKLNVSSSDPPVMHNFRIGVTFRKL